ncbi:MAG TPA: hypothetical protein VKS20_15150 [Candidatus Acidoferrales bacterium]|nr:hypothetical protein [Candidatus Acidoferrales bacterium]
MPQMQNAQSVALQLEKVRDKLPLLYERDDILLTMIQQRGDVERVSSRNMRLPLQIRPGGKAGLANLDGGDLGRGSGTTYDVAQVSPIFFRHAVEITKLVEYSTNSPEKAIENAAKREVKNAMGQFRSFLDKVMQTNGNGVLGSVSSVVTTGLPAGVAAQINMTTPPGAALFYYNQTIQFYDSTLSTNRNVAGSVTSNVVLVDPFNKFIQIDAIPSGVVAGDAVVHDGLTGAQPVSLFGVPYHQTNATTGTWLNLNRATYPVELATPHVAGNNAAVTPGVVRLAINKVRKALGTNQIGKLIAYTSLEQENAWEQLGISISQIIKEGAGGRASDLDLLFTGELTMAGVPIKSSINANQARIDFLDLSHWGRAVMQDIDFYDVGGQTVFPIYGASGGLAAAYIFYFVTGFQVWNESPRSGAYIDSLAIPTGY